MQIQMTTYQRQLKEMIAYTRDKRWKRITSI